jgi:hypothetical protein
MIDIKVFKLLFFAYKGKTFSFYDKVILAAHWSLIDDNFIVKDQEETVTNYILFYGCLLSFNI